MAEKTLGIYRLVTIPVIYKLIQNSLGGRTARKAFRNEFFPDVRGCRILEIGCGPGTWFPEVKGCREYLGMDWNAEHIAMADKKYGNNKVKFICGDVTKDVPLEGLGYDYIFAFGILHHLSNEQAQLLLDLCSRLLSKSGKFLSVDPVYHENQSFFAKWMNDRDSGQDIRTEQSYRQLAIRVFNNVETTVCTDKLRIPYSHCVIKAS